MPLNIIDQGYDNQIEIHPDVLASAEGGILIKGSGNRVSIGAGCSALKMGCHLGDDCILEIGPNCRLAAIEIVAVRQGHLRIGADTSFNWLTRFMLHEPGLISVGERCLVASDTMLTVSDMHSILDRTTGKRINPAADVIVEDGVWIAHEANVLKGVRIGTGSIIGMGSVVVRDIPPHCLATGRPAAVIRENVAWRQELL